MSPTPFLREYALPSGQLALSVTGGLYPPEALFSPGCRQNPRRAFLFISHVLGKHLPTCPLQMAQAHDALAAQLTPDLPWPWVFIGMAETATALGQGVFEAAQARFPGLEALYLHTTRYRLHGMTPLAFEESHSHAPRQFLYPPSTPALAALMHHARTLVLIDDEMSTGNTFANLAQACMALAPSLSHVRLMCLTDFTDTQAAQPLNARWPHLDVQSLSLLQGQWRFEAKAQTQPFRTPPAQGAPGCEAVLVDAGFGRLGRTRALDDEALWRVMAHSGIQPNTLSAGERVLVLGMGEFMYAPFRLAKALAQRTGAVVRTHATTRSPIVPWGPITTALSFPDPCGEGVMNHLYNYHRHAYDRVFLCHETPLTPALQALARALGATLCAFTPTAGA